MRIEEELPRQSGLWKMGHESREECGEIEGVTRMTRLFLHSEFQFKDVEDAAKRIRGEVKKTPLEVCTILTIQYANFLPCADIVSHHKHRNPGGCQKSWK